MRKRHANWIIPRRTRALPALARPFSRRRRPLSSGEPVSPAYLATALVGRAGEPGVSGDRALIAQVARERFMGEHIRCLNAEAIDPPQLQNFGVRRLLRRLFQLFQTRRLDLLDLLVDEAQMRHLALEFGQCVGRNGTTFRRSQRHKPLRCLAQFWVEAADSETHQGCFHAIDDTGAFADQLLALTGRAFCVLPLQGWDRCDGAVLLLAAQPTKEGALEKPDIQPIGLRPWLLA